MSKDNFGGTFGAVFSSPHQNYIFGGIVHFKHTHMRHPNTLLVALLVRRCLHLVHHTKNTHFCAWCISNTPTKYPNSFLVACLVQRNVHSACHTNDTHFLALCISNTPLSKDTFGGLFGAEIRAFSTPHQNHIF